MSKTKEDNKDFCDCCFEFAVLRKSGGQMVCKECRSETSKTTTYGKSYAVLDDTSDMAGVYSDEAVIDYYRNEYAAYND